MNAITEMKTLAAVPAAESGTIVMDCQLQKIFYGDFLAVRDSHVPIE
jgi:phosphate transport system ATP-binding protein